MTARGGSRKDGPLLEGPAVDEGIAAVLGWMKTQQLVTEDRHGNVRLRSRGRAIRAVLNTIHDLTEGNRP